MLTFNNKYIIFKDVIFKKDGSLSYRLPKELINILKVHNSSNKICDIDDEYIKYFKNISVFIEDDIYYNPFVKIKEANKFRLFIQLTDNCNLNCRHCFQGDKRKKSKSMSFEYIKDLIFEAINLGIYSIDFTGGEIFTLEYIDDLLIFLSNLPVRTSLFTNLAFLSENDLDAIVNCSGINNIITSIDYFEPEKHDIFRGKKGAFKSTIKNIKFLKENDVSVLVNTMLLKNNRKDIMKLVKYFEKINIKTRLDTVTIKGNAKKNKDLFFINDISNYIYDIYKELGYSDQDLYESIINSKCGVGETLLYFDCNGEFQLCPGLTSDYNEKFKIGDTLTEAIQNLNSFRISCKENSCEYHGVCTYGCRERALEYSDSILGKDFRMCELLNRLYKNMYVL